MSVCIEPSGNLIQWLSDKGVNLKNVVLHYKESERALVTTQSISKGQVILHIPTSLILHSELNGVKGIRRKVQEKLSNQAFLAAYMLAELEKPNSLWCHYLNTLPAKFEHIPVFFNEDKLSQLQGSPVVERILTRRKKLHDNYQIIRKAFSQDCHYTLEEFMWACTSINSRSFSFGLGDQKIVAMVPLIDMCNHHCSPNAFWEGDDLGFTLRALKPISASEELLVSYGDKSDGRFYQGYGFFPEGNKRGSARINVHLDTASQQYDLHKALLNGYSQMEFEVNDVWGEKIYPIFKVLRTMQLSSNSESYIEKINCHQATDLASEQQVISYFKVLILQSLALYPSTMEEDIALLEAGAESKMDNRVTYRNLLMVLKEKQVLNNLLCFCSEASEHLAKLAQGQASAVSVTACTLFKMYVENSLNSSAIIGSGPASRNKITASVNFHTKICIPKVSLTQVTPSVWAALHSISLHADDRTAVPTTHSLLKDVAFGPCKNVGPVSRIQAAAIWANNQPIGVFTYLWQSKNSVWFGGFQIDQAWQGNSFGKGAVLAFLSMLVADDNFNNMQLDVISGHYKVLRFYQRLGFMPMALNTQEPEKWILKLTRHQAEKLLALEGYSIAE